jgi:hypothetical protein
MCIIMMIKTAREMKAWWTLMVEHDSVDHGLAGRCVDECVQWSELSTAMLAQVE